MKETKVFIEDFKGNKLLAIWEVDQDGNKVGAFPIISFGRKKAEAIVKHENEVKNWVNGIETN